MFQVGTCPVIGKHQNRRFCVLDAHLLIGGEQISFHPQLLREIIECEEVS